MRIESDPCTEVTREPGPLLGGLLIFICDWVMLSFSSFLLSPLLILYLYLACGLGGNGRSS